MKEDTFVRFFCKFIDLAETFDTVPHTRLVSIIWANLFKLRQPNAHLRHFLTKYEEHDPKSNKYHLYLFFLPFGPDMNDQCM